jgi:hypothetical protein
VRITAVTTTMPGPLKPRLWGFTRALRLAGHDVCVVATSDFSQGRGSGAGEDPEALGELGVPVTSVPYALSARQVASAIASVALRRSCTETALYDSKPLAERVMAAVDASDPDVVHVDRVRTLALVRELAAPTVVDVTDPRLGTYEHYRRAGQLRPVAVGASATLRAWLDRRPAVREEARGLRRVPTLVASEIGREVLLGAGADPARVWQLPNAVFADERVEPLAEQGEQLVVGMSGNFSYPPNVLGFETLAKDIAPELVRELGARIVAIGSSPHRQVVRTARRAGIEIHANVRSVPETIRELGVSVMLSPQRISTGFPNRVVDAVYRAGVPVLVSPETARGMPADLAPHVPVADTPEEWLRQTSDLAGAASGEAISELQERIEGACGPVVVLDTLTSAYGSAMEALGRTSESAELM